MTTISKVIVFLTLGVALKFAQTWAVFSALNYVLYPLFAPGGHITFEHSFLLALALALIFGSPKRTEDDQDFANLMSEGIFLTLFYAVSTGLLIIAANIFL